MGSIPGGSRTASRARERATSATGAPGREPRSGTARVARDVPAGRPVIAVCRSGKRSTIATGKLLAAGLDARNLTGGMTAWAQAGLPVRTDDGREGTVA